MVFVIVFLVLSARKGTSLALRNRPRQNRGKSLFRRKKAFSWRKFLYNGCLNLAPVAGITQPLREKYAKLSTCLEALIVFPSSSSSSTCFFGPDHFALRPTDAVARQPPTEISIRRWGGGSRLDVVVVVEFLAQITHCHSLHGTELALLIVWLPVFMVNIWE